MSKIIYDPLGIFEQNESKGGVCTVKTAYVALTAAALNQTVIAAVTGKKIVVLEGVISSVAAVGVVLLKNGSSGAGLRYYNVPANTSTPPFVQIEPVVFGAIETSSGIGLFADTTGADIKHISLRYIEVVP